MSDGALRAAARRILDANWLGAATKPAPRLYPHQWSWDSAFIAIGNRHDAWERAALELETLFAAQWSNGLLPHIVFSDVEADYFPSADFWGSTDIGVAPRSVRTSGIVQPPVHATAARLVYEARRDDEGRAFLGRLYPRLMAWHEYLVRARAAPGALIEIWHPWESGMDNSPLWDGPLALMDFGPEDVPGYRRVDTSIADSADRPTDRQYEEYAFLVGRLRHENYIPDNRRSLPFRVHDVLFNSLFAAASRDLAFIAEVLGADAETPQRWAAATQRDIEAHLWSEEAGMYLDVDAKAGEQIAARACGGLMPLLIGGGETDRQQQLLETVRESFLEPVGDGAIVPSVPVADPAFAATRYWRGPAWIQINWLVRRGLVACGADELAAAVRRGILTLVADGGFWEYFDVTDGSGRGSDDFSWTASLVLDLLAAD